MSLTNREIEVAEGVLRGKRDKEMAAALGLSVGTVSNYLRSLFIKLRVDNRTKVATVYHCLKRGGQIHRRSSRPSRARPRSLTAVGAAAALALAALV